MEECNHNWVHRKDGYEEQCVPAICTKCGKYSCWCDFVKSFSYFEYIGKEEGNRIRKEFFKNGINGDNHELEKRIKEQKKLNIKENDTISRFEIMDFKE